MEKNALEGPAVAWMAGIVFLALAARVAVIFLLRNFDAVTGYENEEIALNLIAGRGYSMAVFGPLVPTAYQYPLYTFFLALHFLLFGKNYLFVEFSQALLGSLSSLLLVYLGRNLFDRLTGLAAGLLCAVYPIYVYWVTRGQALTLEIFLLIALLLLVLRAMKQDRVRDWALAGFGLGLATLSKTIYLILAPAFLLWAWLWRRPAFPRLVRNAAVFGIAAAAAIAPWTIRNAITLHAFVPVTTNGGFNFWVGNNPNASGSIFTADHRGMWETLSPEMLARLRSAPDVEKERIFSQAAWSYIREHPARCVALIPAKLRALWWFDPDMPSDFPVVREVVYVLLLVPALLGMIASRRKWRELSIFYLTYLTLSAAYSVYYGGARFRYVIEFSLILFAASFLVSMARHWGSRLGSGSSEVGKKFIQ